MAPRLIYYKEGPYCVQNTELSVQHTEGSSKECFAQCSVGSARQSLGKGSYPWGDRRKIAGAVVHSRLEPELVLESELELEVELEPEGELEI